MVNNKKLFKEGLHYAILVAGIIYYFHLSGIHAVHSSVKLVLGLAFVVVIIDLIIHKLLKKM